MCSLKGRNVARKNAAKKTQQKKVVSRRFEQNVDRG